MDRQNHNKELLKICKELLGLCETFQTEQCAAYCDEVKREKCPDSIGNECWAHQTWKQLDNLKKRVAKLTS